MPRFARAATIAALSCCATIMVSATTPSFALDLGADRPDIRIAPNAAYPARVPVPPAPIVPTAWTLEPGESPRTLAANHVEAHADARDFATLAAAVAAQDANGALDDEMRCLATGIYYESKGEPLSGQLAVAEVILNRTRSGRYPSSVCGVLKQPRQFSFVRRGRLPTPSTGSQAWKTAVAVAKVARAELWETKVSDALHFHARYVSPNWNRTRIASVGNHIFYR